MRLKRPPCSPCTPPKGLEFSTVFIIGLDEGLLPHSRSLEDPEEMAEERRLFYVGITRAKNHLILVRAGQRSSYGRFDYTQQSRFLDDIPDNLLKREGVRLGLRSVNPLSQPRWQPWSTTGLSRQSGGKTQRTGFQGGDARHSPGLG